MYSQAFGGEGGMMQELVQNLQNMARDMVNSIHTALPGTIVSFDPETGLAQTGRHKP